MKRRVHILSGDTKHDLGTGDFLGYVELHIIRKDDSYLFAEKDKNGNYPKAFQKEVDKGLENVFVYELNPKIKLDNGGIVYGCQVWWEFLDHDGWDKWREHYTEEELGGRGLW